VDDVVGVKTSGLSSTPGPASRSCLQAWFQAVAESPYLGEPGQAATCSPALRPLEGGCSRILSPL